MNCKLVTVLGAQIALVGECERGGAKRCRESIVDFFNVKLFILYRTAIKSNNALVYKVRRVTKTRDCKASSTRKIWALSRH